MLEIQCHPYQSVDISSVLLRRCEVEGQGSTCWCTVLCFTRCQGSISIECVERCNTEQTEASRGDTLAMEHSAEGFTWAALSS